MVQPDSLGVRFGGSCFRGVWEPFAPAQVGYPKRSLGLNYASPLSISSRITFQSSGPVEGGTAQPCQAALLFRAEDFKLGFRVYRITVLRTYPPPPSPQGANGRLSGFFI